MACLKIFVTGGLLLYLPANLE